MVSFYILPSWNIHFATFRHIRNSTLKHLRYSQMFFSHLICCISCWSSWNQLDSFTSRKCEGLWKPTQHCPHCNILMLNLETFVFMYCTSGDAPAPLRIFVQLFSEKKKGRRIKVSVKRRVKNPKKRRLCTTCFFIYGHCTRRNYLRVWCLFAHWYWG